MNTPTSLQCILKTLKYHNIFKNRLVAKFETIKVILLLDMLCIKNNSNCLYPITPQFIASPQQHQCQYNTNLTGSATFPSNCNTATPV